MRLINTVVVWDVVQWRHSMPQFRGGRRCTSLRYYFICRGPLSLEHTRTLSFPKETATPRLTTLTSLPLVHLCGSPGTLVFLLSARRFTE